VLDILANASAVIAEGEVLQLTAAANLATTEATYLQVVRGKTAALFAAAMEVGAVIAAAPQQQVRALFAYGDALGVAFQIADDILDCAGDTIETGKIAGTDLREGTPTLPLLLAARVDDAVHAALAGGPTAGVLLRVAATGALERSREMALDYAREARESLNGGPHRDELEALADAVVNRST
jgi:octaprenyl-diphosphate synthase